MHTVHQEDLAHIEGCERAFNAALAAFQGEVQAAKRDGKNPHFRNTYATLASVIEAVKPACKQGLSHTQTLKREGDQLLLVTTLRHKDGHAITSELPLVLGNDWQRFGSGYTYARRFALMGIYGIASCDDPSDDDGTAAGAGDGKRMTAASSAKPPSLSPIEQRAQSVTQALTALHEADPEAVKPLVEEYRATFKVPAKTPVARSFNEPDRLSWFEQRLGFPNSNPAAPDATAP